MAITKLSDAANRHKPLLFTLLIFLMGYGGVSYFTLPAQEDPQFLVREAVVTTDHPGLAARRVELLITKPLERALNGIPEVKEIHSTSTHGKSVIHVKIEDKYFNLGQLWDAVRKRVREVTPSLPPGTQPPRVDDEFGDVAIVTAAITSEADDPAQLGRLAEHLQDDIYGIEGTKRVELHGYVPDVVEVELDPRRVEELGLTPEYIASALRRRNVLRSAGRLDSHTTSFVLLPTEDLQSTEDVANSLIVTPDGSTTLRLSDIGRVTRTAPDPTPAAAFFNGAPAIVVAASMQSGQRALDYGARVRAYLEGPARDMLPAGYSVDIVTYQPEAVARAVFGVSESVLQTLAIVLAVVIVFLGLRTGLIVGAIVPAVMLATLGVMGLYNLPLERMSLATLVISLGLLVDNGIVVAED
ncbi:MAG: efflux RND transporter permease subunit [Myxococcota bacterium]